jgi:replicative DNA helicase Mcm
MPRADNQDLVDSFEQFYRRYYSGEIGDLARNYPRERKSLYLDWTDLFQFDPDIAEEYRSKPDQYRESAEEALRLYDLPVDVSLGQAHVRVRNLDDHTDIRDIRSRHVGRLVSVQGMVRKATDVRPKVREAAFECQRCGTLTRISQPGGGFQEPHECGGCERQGPFSVNFDQSEFIDSQKLRIQESPEGLRGGETPQSIDVHIEDDITGQVTPGDHVTVTGVLDLDQQESGQEKTAVFDVYMEGQSVEIEDEEFEDMDITDEDKADIIELSENGDIYQRMVESIAPNIYGHEQAKLAMMLQLFSGVTKHLPDGSRTRGDLHMLLIGDPGTGKCLGGDTRITLSDGRERPIREIVEENLDDPKPIDDGVYNEVDIMLPSMGPDGTITERRATKVWKREAPETMYRVRTASGREVEVTPSHPLFVQQGAMPEAIRAEDLSTGEFIATPRTLPTTGDDALNLDVRRSKANNAVRIDVPDEWTPEFARLVGYVIAEGYIERRTDGSGYVSVTNNDREILSDVTTALESLNANYTERPSHEGKDATEIYAGSSELVSVFESLAPAMLSGSGDQRVPDALMGATAGTKAAFLRAYVDAEGHVSTAQRELTVASMSEALLKDVRSLLLGLGIRSQRHERKNGSFRLRISGTDFSRYVSEVGFVTDRKTVAAAEVDTGRTNTNDDTVPGIGTALQETREDLGLTQADCGLPRSTYQHYERGDRNPSRESLRSVASAFGDARGDARADGGVPDTIDSLAGLAENDLHWDRIDSIEAIETSEEWVYDLEVAGTHTYLSNGVVSHNSQMLQYVQNIAPRSVYTSGKGSSAAGLTAAAVRDDFGDGQQWTLEAGALVLADQGIAAVDELDKMRCVTGDTLVHLGDGRIERIGELARGAENDGEVEELPNGRTIRDLDLTAWAMDDGDIVRRDVTAVHEYDAPEMLSEVTLETGESLTATDDHPFFVFENGERVERAAAELETGDWVYVPRSVPRTASDGGAETLAVSDESDNSIGPAMGAVLGYLSGDGNIRTDDKGRPRGVRFTNAEEELRADFERCARLALDGEPYRPPSEQRADGVGTVRIDGTENAERAIEAGMNTEIYDGKSFPTGVTDGSSETKAAFVRALADSEGCVDTTSGNIAIASASRELLTGTKELLLEFGISAQIQTRLYEDKRDIYNLVITDADSLRAFHEHIGFTLERKQFALASVAEAAGGDRTILDVLPGVSDLLRECRESLRLHQSECGIQSGTYADFETEQANISLHRARRVLDAFRARKQEAIEDTEALSGVNSWEDLEAVKERYHVSQREIAEKTEYSQQQVSREWGASEALRGAVEDRLSELIDEVATADLGPLPSLVHGDVKWRRVKRVKPVEAEARTDRSEPHRRKLADVLRCAPSDAVERAKKLLADGVATETPEEIAAALDRHGVSHESVASDLGVNQSTVTRWLNGAVETNRFAELQSVVEERLYSVRGEIRDLLDGIRTRQTPKVYDLTVEGTHNFIANGMVVHNSEDQSAMHEALEQQEISVAKAGINATLKSRCSLLGAANPTYGRFDQYEPIGEQIDLDPPLISRFDLIFTVTDKPDEEKDRRLAEHILRTNYAGELNTHRTKMTSSNVAEEEVEAVVEDVAPEIDAEFLRKYIAYSRRNCFPTMSDEAKEAIENFYVDLRSQGAGEDAPVPVTARKLEALVRLAEASARVRLSDSVEKKDADRVIEIVRSCLMDIGVDPETGEFDADVVETGTSKTQRDRIRGIKEIVKELQQEYDDGAPVEKILDEAEQNGMERTKAEHEIEKLKQQGELYQPNQDHLRTL